MTSVPDPYAVASSPDRPFWADSVADAIEERDPDEPIVVKGGVSPSGIPHLGHLNELMRGYFVAAVLRERGYAVEQVFTADDRDRLRAIPRQLADSNSTVVGLDKVDAGALGRNLGRPYTDIPDPFGCCDSYGAHFTALLEESADRLDVDVEFVSNSACYDSGAFDPIVRHVLANRVRARDVLGEFQAKIDTDYIPFFAICEDCGQLTEETTGVDLSEGTVSYVCTDIESDGTVIEGCGNRGEVSLREGKLPWRFEWPAQWQLLDVDFEPFGKDHAEGSWPSGTEIATRVLDIEPPIGMVYEWFTIEGEPLSSSAGNVVTVAETLDLLEPAVLRYFFSKEPLKQRDFSIEHIDQLVDEFDRFERIYHDEVPEASERERMLAERVYPLLIDDPERRRVRIPYTFAAVLGMTEDPDLREEIARREGHIPPDASDVAVDAALERVDRAQTWARRTDNEFNYELKRTSLPPVDIDAETASALDELADFVAAGHDGEAIQGEIYEVAKRHDLDVGNFFSTGYRLFFDEDEGPKLGQFLGNLDRDFVVARLRRER